MYFFEMSHIKGDVDRNVLQLLVTLEAFLAGVAGSNKLDRSGDQ